MNKTNERQAYQCPKINVLPIHLSNSFASEVGVPGAGTGDGTVEPGGVIEE